MPKFDTNLIHLLRFFLTRFPIFREIDEPLVGEEQIYCIKGIGQFVMSELKHILEIYLLPAKKVIEM